jgi:hypothetical protein
MCTIWCVPHEVRDGVENRPEDGHVESLDPTTIRKLLGSQSSKDCFRAAHHDHPVEKAVRFSSEFPCTPSIGPIRVGIFCICLSEH